MTSEIDQLKLELTSSRLKNGVYLPVEVYNEKMELIETQSKTITALEDEVDLTKKKLKEIQDTIEEYKNNYRIEAQAHQLTKTELVQTQMRNKEVEEELKKKLEEIEIKKYIIEENRKTEKSLHGEAETLIQIIKSCIYDLNQCHEKIDSSKEIFTYNKGQSQRHSDLSIQKLKSLGSKIELFNQKYENSKNESLLSISTINESRLKEFDHLKDKIEKINTLHENASQTLFNLLKQSRESGKKRMDNLISNQDFSEKKIQEIISNSNLILKEFMSHLESTLMNQKIENTKLSTFIQEEFIKNSELISTFTDLSSKLLSNYEQKLIESSNLQGSLLKNQQDYLKQTENEQLQRFKVYKNDLLKGVENLIQDMLVKESKEYHSTSNHLQHNLTKVIVKNEELEKEFKDFNTTLSQKNLEFKKEYNTSNQKSFEECNNLLKNGLNIINESNHKSQSSINNISKNFESIGSSIKEDTNRQIKIISDEENQMKVFKTSMDERINHSLKSTKERNQIILDKEKDNQEKFLQLSKGLEDKIKNQENHIHSFVQNLSEFTKEQTKESNSFIQTLKNDDVIIAPVKKEISYSQKLSKSKEDEILIKEYKDKHYPIDKTVELKERAPNQEEKVIQIPNSPLKRKKEETHKKSISSFKTRSESIGNHLKKRKVDKENFE